MKTDINKVGTVMTVSVSGRLDTTTAPELEAAIKNSLEGVTKLIFDMNGLEYISSAGLRVLLTAQKIMSRQEGMTVKNCSAEIREIFDITGFTDILTIE